MEAIIVVKGQQKHSEEVMTTGRQKLPSTVDRVCT